MNDNAGDATNISPIRTIRAVYAPFSSISNVTPSGPVRSTALINLPIKGPASGVNVASTHAGATVPPV